MLSNCTERGHKVLLMGNGGSAPDAQHVAGEMTGRFERDRAPLPFVSLTTDSSILPAIGIDLGFENVFSRQVAALADRGDVVICFSTGGESENIIRGARKAKEIGADTIGFLGEGGSSLSEIVDIPLNAPSKRTCRRQECHIARVHILCECLENQLAEAGGA